MKALRVNEWGKPFQLEDVPQPKPASDEVLVKVHAASLNPFDVFVHAGYMQAMLGLPLTLGTDFSGEVVEAGQEITHVKPGDAVYGLVPMRSGSFTEYLIAKSNEVALKPKTLNYVEAAGVPLASLAAYQSLFDLGQAQTGERVLIIGAGGAVGVTAVQLAKNLGSQVYAVDIAEKAGFVRQFGPHQYIDAVGERYENISGSMDLVLDFVGGENLQRSLNVLKSGGRYVTSLMMQSAPEEAEKRGITALGLATQPKVDQLDDLTRRIDTGQLKVFINRTFPLSEAQAAFEYRMSTKDPGKIVLQVI